MPAIPLDAFLDDKFQQRLKGAMAKWAIPGVSIALTHGDGHKVVCLGERDVGLPMTPRTRMPLASNTKLLTVLTTAQALELSGYPLGLKSRVKDVHPAFKLKDKQFEEGATFEDIFSHRLGLPAHNFLLSRPLSEGETVGERLSHVDPLIHDDKWTTYSNATYDLAVEIVERLVGMPYGDFVRQAILAPLSMSDSSYTTERSTDVAPMAAGWHKVVDANGWKPSVFRLEDRLDQMGEKVGMGGIRFMSTAEDMCAYLKHLPGNPAYQDACAPRLLHSGRASCRFPDGDVEYGLGVTIASSRGIPIVGHTGACSGFRSYVGRFPAQDIGVAVLINSTNGDELHALIQIHILGIILGEDLSHLEDRLDEEREVGVQRYIHHFAPVHGRPSAASGPKGEDLLLGTYTSPAFGEWSFDRSSNLRTRPGCAIIPTLGRYYGSVRPVVTAVGGGRFEGCIEWKGQVESNRGNKAERCLYGMPFVAEVKGDELRLYHFHEGGGPRSNADPVVVLDKSGA